MDNSNKILIKSKDGQFKTVGLGVSDNRLQTTDDKQSRREVETSTETQGQIKERQQFNQQKDEKEKSPTETKQDKPIIKDNVKSPAFYFAIEDEEEIARFKNSKDDEQRIKRDKAMKVVTDQLAEEVTEVSESYKNRLKQAILSRLKDVRTLIETKEALTKDIDKGGVGLSQQAAHDLIKKISVKQTEMEEKNWHLQGLEQTKVVKEEVKEKGGKEIVSKPSSFKQEIPVLEKKVEEIKPPSLQKPTVYSNLKTTASRSDFDKIKIKRNFEKNTNKPLMGDVKKIKRTKGPVDELGEIDLKEFRTLGSTAKERVNKIYEKIKLLENESVEKKHQGIIAWKSSPLYKEYLKIGSDSLINKRTINDILKDGTSLSFEEFQAIADLNEELNY